MPNFSFGKSIKTQMIVLLFGLTAISIAVVGFLGVRGLLDSGQKGEKLTLESAQARAQELLTQTTAATADNNSLAFRAINDEVETLGKYTEQVFNNPGGFTSAWKFDQHVFRKPSGQWWNDSSELPNILLGNFITSPTPALKKEIELLHNLDYLAPQVIQNHPNVVALYFIGALGESFYYPNIDLGNIIPPDLKPNTLDFYTIVTPRNDPKKEARWTNVYDDPAGNGLTITASRPVYSPEDSFRGAMSIDVTLQTIAKNIEAYSPIESSYAFLIDKDGRAIALPSRGYADMLGRQQKQGEFGPDLQKVGGDFGTVLQAMRKGREGFGQAHANKQSLYVAYAPVSGTDFSLGIVAKKDVLLKVVGDLRAQVERSTNQVLYFQILPFAALILLLVWALGFLYIRYLTGPIMALTQKANRLLEGSTLNQEINLKMPDNEVGRLTQAFNKMIRELSDSYRALQNKVVELGDAKAKDEAILNSIGDGLIVSDPEGGILLINNIAAELLGFDATHKANLNIADYNLFDTSGAVLAPENRPIRVALTTGKRVNREVRAGKGDAKLILTMTATPVIDQGKTIGAIETIRDVTKERELDRMKTEFISIASHQLRTPLSAIKWFTEMLLHGDAGEVPKEQVEFITNIHDSTNRMIELVNSLLTISRLESGGLAVSSVPTDLKSLVESTLSELNEEIKRRNQKLNLTIEEGLPHVKLDSKLISQVYLNLIGNSVKYTPSGGSIDIKISRKDNEVVSEVKDNGYGVPALEQKKMFKKFFRGTNITGVETDGTGLGAYLSKAIVESSGGKIWFESKEGKGSTFWFSLPLE